MPLGRRYRGPSDKLSSALAQLMQTDTVLRQRLTSACYIGDNATDPCYRVEHAWRSGDPDAIWDAIQVDEFEGAFTCQNDSTKPSTSSTEREPHS